MHQFDIAQFEDRVEQLDGGRGVFLVRDGVEFSATLFGDVLGVTGSTGCFSAADGPLLERLGGGRYLLEIHPRQRLETFGPTARMLLATLRRITGRDLSEQLFDSVDQATSLLRECGFSRARVLTEDELEGAADAPLPRHRAFVLVAADV